MGQRYGKDISMDSPLVKGYLSVVLKKPHQHAVIRYALAFQMVFFGLFPNYLKTCVRDSFLCVPALLI